MNLPRFPCSPQPQVHNRCSESTGNKNSLDVGEEKEPLLINCQKLKRGQYLQMNALIHIQSL